MSITWEYPVFLLPHFGGYVAIVDPGQSDPPSQLLVVMTDHEMAAGFMEQFQIPGRPRALNNAREFRWLVESVRAPITQVAFDPQPTADEINARWQVTIAALIADHLHVDFSPWNYPVYVAAHETGFASIQGQSPQAESVNALCLFTSEEKANQYLQSTGEGATLCPLADLDEAAQFLNAIADQVAAVALDPTASEEGRTAKHCFMMETLLGKYLVRNDSLDQAGE